MTTAMNTTPDEDDWTPSRWDNARWTAGNRLTALGERFMLLGDRLRGDTPQTVDQLMTESHARGVKAGVESMTRLLLCRQ